MQWKLWLRGGNSCLPILGIQIRCANARICRKQCGVPSTHGGEVLHGCAMLELCNLYGVMLAHAYVVFCIDVVGNKVGALCMSDAQYVFTAVQPIVVH